MIRGAARTEKLGRTPRWLPVLVAVLVAPACDRTGGSGRAFATRDSSGVRIAENTAAPVPTRSLGDIRPEVVIGNREGAGEYLFSSIAGAFRLSDGRIVVADGRQSEIRFFDRKGRFVKRVGRQGSGPGEYEALELSRARGDTLLVYDFIQRRLTILDGGGGLVRTVPINYTDTHSAAGYWYLGRLEDGSTLLRSVSSGLPAAPGVRRDSLRIVRVTEDGRLLDEWGRFPGDETFHVSTGRGTSSYPLAFGRKPQFLPSGNSLLFGSGDSYEVREYTDGRLRGIVRKQQEPTPLAPTEIQAFKERWVSGFGAADRPRLRRVADEMPYPKTLPAHGRLLSAGEDGLWVQQYTASPNQPEAWDRFDAEGRWVGTTILPERFRATQAGRDFVLGIGTDSVGVERVLLYRLPGS